MTSGENTKGPYCDVGSCTLDDCDGDHAPPSVREMCAQEIEQWVLRNVGIPYGEHPEAPWVKGVLHAASVLRQNDAKGQP